MAPRYKFLFDFAASYSGGGRKRLLAYAEWFGSRGGAWFVVHPNCRQPMSAYPDNTVFVVSQSKYRRLWDDGRYLEGIRKAIGEPELYYSYGIPVYSRIGSTNWFHLSNVLPLSTSNTPVSLTDRVKFFYLGSRIRRGFEKSDVISAESAFSLGLIAGQPVDKMFLSVNGSDDELAVIGDSYGGAKDNIATVVGTYRYKAIDESFAVFETLRDANPGLKLVIIGDPRHVPRALRDRQDVVVRGSLDRSEVVACLRRTKFYISTTYIENSYNAASEGVFIADESYVSDIGPHRELLEGMRVARVAMPNVQRMLLHVKRKDLSSKNLRTWSTVVVEMIARLRGIDPSAEDLDR